MEKNRTAEKQLLPRIKSACKEHTNGLFFAARYGQPKKVIAYLISIGPDVNNVKNELRVYSCGSYGTPKIHPAQSVLDVALQNGDTRIIALLKDNGAKTAAELLKQ